MSDITTLRPGKAFFPVGFQTLAKTNLIKITEKIDSIVFNLEAKDTILTKAKVDGVTKILDLIEPSLVFDSGYSFDWEACRAAIEYYSKIAAPPESRGDCYVLAATDRNLSRIREDKRYSNNPHTKQQLDLLSQYSESLPVVMFFRQNGNELSGWRGGPFWWPVMFPPTKSAPAIFASSEGASNDSEDAEEIDQKVA